MAEHQHHGHFNSESNDMGHDMNMNMHAMTFHFGSKESILFSFWNSSSPIGIIISCFLVFAGCVLLESIRWFRLHRNYNNSANNLTTESNGRRKIDTFLLIDTLLFAVQLFITYLAMLVFMTFNIWLCATIIVAETLTHLAFRVFLPHLEHIPLSASTQPCCG